MERIMITGAGSELQGVGRLSDGRAVFVPGALAHEEVEIEITRDAGRFCEAKLLKIIRPSEHRVSSACPYYGVCGGCSARHMDYAYSLELKRQRVYDAISRIGGVHDPMVYPTIGCKNPDRARNKAEYPLMLRGNRIEIGGYAPKSKQIVPLKDCLLQKEASVRVLNWCAEHLASDPCARHIRFVVTRVNRAGNLTLVFSGDAPIQAEIQKRVAEIQKAVPEMVSLYYCKLKMRPAHALDGFCSWVWGSRTMKDTLLGLTFDLSPQSFFQVNPEQAELLYTRALDALDIEAGKPMRVLDAYCGAGTITLAAAKRGAEAVGVEIIAPAIENAKENARVNGLSRQTRFICADAAREIPRMIAAGECFDAAILDPPRKGADEALLFALAQSGVPKIAYVSCNPSTLARDIKRLCELGYAFEWAQPIDMFPQTEHVETVVLLSQLKADHHIEVDLDLDELDVTSAESKATYNEIQQYVLKETGLMVSNLYIAQIKRANKEHLLSKCGIEVGESFNKPKTEGARQPKCPEDKEKAIKDALVHFGMI